MKADKTPPPLFDTAEILNFNFEGKNVRGYRWNADKPHKVLILHGFSSSAQNFHYYLGALVKKGCQALAFDAPAHGNSGGNTINAMQYGNMIEEVNRLYGPFNSFMGHSLGGLALSLALENILHDEHTKVVFIAPATETTTAVDAAFKVLQINDETIRQEFDNIILEISGHPTTWFSIKRALKKITAEILWIHDEDDDVTPLKDALVIKEQAPKNIHFIITKGLGHRKIYRDPAIQKKVVQFL